MDRVPLNVQLATDPNTLKDDLATLKEHEDPSNLQVFQEEDEQTIRSMKGGQSPGVDNLPSGRCREETWKVLTDLLSHAHGITSPS